MKFSVNQTELNTALQHLVRNTDNKFFTDVKMTTIDGKLILQTTNGEVSMEYKLPVLTADEETILVNARQFTDIVSKLSGTIIFDNGMIMADKSKLKIELKKDSGYTFFSEIECDNPIIFSAKEMDMFKTSIKNRLFACENNAQNVLSGVCLNSDEVATCNGNILAVYRLHKQFLFDTVVLSNKMAQEILKCFDDDTVQVSIIANKIMFKTDKLSLVGLLLIGNYPKYKQIIPTPQYHANINKQDVINAIELLKLIDDKSCTLNFSQDKLVIEVKDSQTEIEIKYDGADMSIIFNSNYMINCLKNISGDMVDFGFTNNKSALLLSTDKELTLLMPIVR